MSCAAHMSSVADGMQKWVQSATVSRFLKSNVSKCSAQRMVLAIQMGSTRMGVDALRMMGADTALKWS